MNLTSKTETNHEEATKSEHSLLQGKEQDAGYNEHYATIEEVVASRRPTINVAKEVKSLRKKMKCQNKTLYSTLGEAYGLFYVISSSSEPLKKKYRNDIERLQEKFGQKKSSRVVHTAIVRLVFDTSEMERQRVSTYACVLKNAHDADISPEGFLDWLADLGGIDKASRQANKAKTAPVDINDALEALDYAKEIAVMTVPEIGKVVRNQGFEFKLAFCRWDSAKGELSIFKLIENEDKVKSAFRPYAKEVISNASHELAEQDVRNESKLKFSVLDAAIGELS